MLFRIHATLMLELLALIASAFLLLLGNKQECCKGLYKIIAYFGIALSLGALGCSAYHGYQYSRSGLLHLHEPGMLRMNMGMKHDAGPKNPLEKASESAPAMQGCMP